MFKKSKIEKQLNLQSSVSVYIEGKSYQQFSDKTAWHNVFFNQITARVDEDLFSCLYSTAKGAPNASIRVMVAMMLLKEGFGWSDEQLFEQCRFNLLVRKALGIINLDEAIPSESTYYLFRKHIVEYKNKTQKDLFAEIFKLITTAQIIEFEVSGKNIRMDSKLIGSNIAFFSRYEIVHRSLCLLLETKPVYINLLNQQDQSRLKEITQEESSKTVYRQTKDQIKDRLNELGILIYKIISIASKDETLPFATLKRIFDEQYRVQENQAIELRPKEEISAQSVQSPYDTDCSYRKKNDTVIKGYSHNVTETCNPNGLNLITDIQTLPASAADNDFVETALDNSTALLIDKIENVHADGAYHSDKNQDYTKKNTINFYLTGLQGAESRYDLIPVEDMLEVIDKHTGKTKEVYKTKKNKFRITTEKGYRYFTEEEISKNRLRKEIEQYPVEIKNRRNNVEATIYQLAYPLRKDKTRYRGLIKNQMWATLRCLWVNFARIVKKVVKSCQGTSNNTSFNRCVNYLILSVFSTLNLTRLELNGFYKNEKIEFVLIYSILRGVQNF